MASKNKSQPQKSGDTLEEKFDMILESLSKLNERLCSTTEDPLGRSDKEKGITERHNQKGTLEKSHSAPPAMGLVPFDGQLIMRLIHHLQILKLKLGKLKQLQINVGEELGTHLFTVQSLLYLFRVSSQTTIKIDLEGIDSKISDLLYQVPLLSVKTEKQNAAAYGVQDDEDEVHQEKSYYDLPGIHTNVADLTKLEVFRQVKHKFKELDIEQKICLLSFAVFPENREVHRTMLMYWWIGEGIIPVQGAEEAVRKVLKEFIDKKLVEPVEERRKLAPSSYKMSPFVHSSVVLLSKEIGIFDIYRQGQKPTMTCSKMGKVCLVEGSSSQPEKILMPYRDHIETVVNISEGFPEFTLNWFSKPPSNKKFMIKLSKTWFKALKVFYLGRWERSKKRNIQIQNPRLMQCLKHLTKLRFLSFQGISTISSLNSSVCKLHKLIILDLRDCYDLK